MNCKNDDLIFKIDTFYHQFQYPKRSLLFSEIYIPKGKLTIITGETGLGKTTLLNLLGLEDDFNINKSSEIKFKPLDNEDEIKFSKIYNKPKKIQQIRESYFGFMFQHDYLIDSLTCLENVIIPFILRLNLSGHDPYEKIKNLIDEFEFHDLLDAEKTNENITIPPPMDRSPSTLSGGQRQRVSLLRAMIHTPAIIFADEPMASINTEVAEKIMAAFIKKVKLGMSIIIVGHDTHKHIYQSIGKNDFKKYVETINLEKHVTKS